MMTGTMVQTTSTWVLWTRVVSATAPFDFRKAISDQNALHLALTVYHPGDNTGLGRDHTIFATIDGAVTFHTSSKGRTYVSVAPLPMEAAE